jgi:GSH-dependent disulfide-bond oxidoreductase
MTSSSSSPSGGAPPQNGNGGSSNPNEMAPPVHPSSLFVNNRKIELYYSPTPNGWKISILLAEANLPYELIPVDLGAGDQFSPSFQKLSPNGKMPAVRIITLSEPDELTQGSGKRRNTGNINHVHQSEETVFESGAIMLRLAEIFPKEVGQFYPEPYRKNVLEWLFWMNANLGPMAGQVSHFTYYAPKVKPEGDHSYALDR